MEHYCRDKKYCDSFYDTEYKNDIRKNHCEICGISKMMSFKLWGGETYTSS